MYRTQTLWLVSLLAILATLLISIAQNVSAQTIQVSEPREILLPRGEEKDFGKAPDFPSGPLKPDVKKALNTAFGENLKTATWAEDQSAALTTLAASKDPRVVWIISDFMRIISNPGFLQIFASAASDILEIDIALNDAWAITTDHLIAWDIPAPPGYLTYKRNIFTVIVPEWDRIFVEGDIDWRHVSWGGVRIDNRPFDTTDKPCNCIPAADNPKVSSAEDATWLTNDAVIFGIEVNGESRAYPRRIMEVREMINDTLGGRNLGIPYCTLCGAAQAYFTDQLANGIERPILRTSGLLIRSNKVMYDVNTFSVFDTFRGNAVTGPLHSKGITLKQAGVVTTSWGEWKKAHPKTTVLIEELALGRDFDFRNNRDAKGPIFPVGDVDPRLPAHEDVLGIVTSKGTPVAFHINSALKELSSGKKIAIDNVHLILDGGGVRAVDKNGQDLGGHQAFWFAWSQFYPKTRLWPI